MYQSQSAPDPSWHAPAPNYLTDAVAFLAQLSLIGYICQTALFAPFRYILVALKLQFLWYLPDIMGLICIVAVLALDATRRSFRSSLFLLVLLFYALEGYAVSGSVASVLSTFKALVPLFCGLLLDRSLLTTRFMRRLLLLFWSASCGGILYSLYGNPPWSSLQFEGVGVAQAYKAAQWTTEGSVRIYGFGGDQHGAASSVLCLFVLLHLSYRKQTFYLFGLISLVAIYLTTSRTNLAALVVFLGLSTVVDLRTRATSQRILRQTLKISFLSVLVPIAVMVFAQWYSSVEVPKALLSIWIRGNETWLAPLGFIDELAPFAVFTGFGLGGIGFGLLQTSLSAYARTIDNFALFNLLTFGMPFVFFYMHQCRQLLEELEPNRVMAFVVVSFVGILLRGWSDYLFMILYGYSARRAFRVVGSSSALRMSRSRFLPGYAVSSNGSNAR